jgi:predicted Zn-dependent protease
MLIFMSHSHPLSADAAIAIQEGVSEATLQFTIGEAAVAIEQLRDLSEKYPQAATAWHALAEILLAEKSLAAALEAGEKAHTLLPDDIHINVSLSRIWVELGDKQKAEHFGAQARMLGWKQELSE